MGKVWHRRIDRDGERSEMVHFSGGRPSEPRGLRLVALGAAVVLSLAACGNRTSQEDLNALLGDRQEAPSPGAQDVPVAGDEFADQGAVEPEVADSEIPALGATPPDGTAASTPTPAPGSVGSRTPSGSPARPSRPAPTRAGQAPKPAPRPAPQQPGSPPPPAPGPGGGSAVPAPAAPAGCSGSEAPMVIGSVGTMSGVVGYLFAPGAKAVSAWAGEINSKGGVNCHKVKHLIGDSGGDPARYQSLVRQFVEREGVMTFVFNPDSFAAQAGADYLEKKGVPVIGGGGGEMFTYDKSMQFPVFAMGVPMQMNQVFQASRVWIPEGKTKIGTVSCVEAEYCPIFDKTVAELAPKLGFEVVYQANVTITAPDYTANCLEARNSGVQAFITSLDGQTNHRFINSCAKVGFNAPLSAASIQGMDDFKDNVNMVGSQIGMNVRPWFSAHPAIAEHRAIFKKHIRDAIFGPAAVNGWTTAKAFESATRRVPANQPVTSKDVLAGLYALNGDDLGGLTYPLRFSPDQPQKKKIVCGWPTVVAAKGKWTAPMEALACAPGFEP